MRRWRREGGVSGWAGKPAAERARMLAQARRPDRRACARTREDRDPGHGPTDRADRQAARAAQRRTTSTTSPRCACAWTGIPTRRPTHLNYTLFHPVGVCALISPWNVPFMTATWKVAPALAFGNTAVLKMSELSPLSAARLGELALGGRNSRRRAQCRARLRRRGGRAAVPASRCARDFLHRLDRDRKPHRQGGGAEEIFHGAGRQEPLRDLRRRRSARAPWMPRYS